MKNNYFSFMKITLTTLALIFIGTSCKKYAKCNSVDLCIKNTGSTVVHYGWGTNMYADSIMPGATACISVGPINTNPNSSETLTEEFDSDHGSYFITVDQCTTITKEIQ